MVHYSHNLQTGYVLENPIVNWSIIYQNIVPMG